MVSAVPYPNDAGFETTPETRTPVKLNLRGKIPAYAYGVLYRTGPGRYTLDAKDGKREVSMAHWFDGFTMNHRFAISDEGVEYSSRYSCDALMKDVAEEGAMREFSFAQPRDPCESMFRKVATLFSKSSARDMPSGGNVGVTLSHTTQGKLVARTDANWLQEIDEKTLEPVALNSYESFVQGQLSAAHGASDPSTGEYFNYTLEMRNAQYTLFKVLPSGETVTLAKINSAKASYIHSIALTPNYVILTVWQAYITNGLKILWNRNILDSITKSWDPTSTAEIYIVPRSGGPAKKYLAPDAFFCFHVINAFEESGEIILDLVRWDTHSVLTEFYVKHLSSASSQVKMADERSAGHVMRYIIPIPSSSEKLDDTQSAAVGRARKDTSFDILKDGNIELPIINPTHHMRPHRFVYGIHNRVSSLADSLIKLDLLTKQTKIWSDVPDSAYATPGEPIFVADPESLDEDGGVLLTIILDGVKRTSALVVIDARTMKVVARAEMATSVAFGFHGSFVAREK